MRSVMDAAPGNPSAQRSIADPRWRTRVVIYPLDRVTDGKRRRQGFDLFEQRD
jgi:hypothetical protein